MNERIQKIKDKMANTPFKDDFDKFMADIQKKVEAEMKNEMSTKVLENMTELIAGFRSLLERRDQGFRDLHAYLEFQKSEIEKKGDDSNAFTLSVIDSIEELSKSLQKTQKVSITNPMSLKMSSSELKKAFSESLDTVTKLLHSINEIPNSGSVMHSRYGVSKIEESYGDYIKTTTYTYDELGRLKGWTTTIS